MPLDDSGSLRNFPSPFAHMTGKGIELDDSGKQRGLKIPESLKFSASYWVIPNPQEALLGIHFHQDGLPTKLDYFLNSLHLVSSLGFKSWLESFQCQKERI